MDPLKIVLLLVLFGSILLILHIKLLYPALLYVVSRFSSPIQTRSSNEGLPSVTVIIAAYNEENVIEAKIKNSLALDYPDEKLEIVVFSDASTDRTDEIVKSYADEGVELVRIEGRVGKTECQNRVAADVDSEILVFSDANCFYEPDAIHRLVEKFVGDVGCVVGELRHTRTEEDVIGESIYWRYNRLVKRFESRIGSVVKGNGAIYAVRREDYVPLPVDAMSDFAEPLAIKERGKTIKYAHDAVARGRTAGSVTTEQSRKIRIATRSWHTLQYHLGLLNPFEYGFYSFQMLTDTLLWWSTPILWLSAFVSALVLWVLTTNSLFALIIGGYIALLVFGFIGRYLEDKGMTTPFVFHISYYFLVGNYSLVVAGWNFLQGRNVITWETMNE